MLESLITSKTRIKILLKFFINPETKTYLRGLAAELGESTNGVRVELDRFAAAGLLEKNRAGKTLLYQANIHHPLFPELNSVVKKYTGIDRLIDDVLKKLGNLESAYITGDYARGMDTGTIDLVLVGDIDRGYLRALADKAEAMIKRTIRCQVLAPEEMDTLYGILEHGAVLPVWSGKSFQ